MPRGGYRPGSGRKPGTVSKAAQLKRRFEDYFTEAEVKDLMADLKNAMARDPKLQIFVLEQLFGKAPQRLEVTGRDGSQLVVSMQYVNPDAGDATGKDNHDTPHA